MRRQPLAILLAILLAFALALPACTIESGSEAPETSDTAAHDTIGSDGTADGTTQDATTAPDTGPACNPGTLWKPGIKAFEDATKVAGLQGVLGIRLSVTDFDGDGWPDLLIRNGGGPEDFKEGKRSRWLMRNNGDGTFSDFTQQSGLLRGRLNSDPNYGRPGDIFVSGDVDNDGDLDIYVATARHKPTDDQETSELMLNKGDGTFELGPAKSDARFVGKPSVPAGATFVDYNRDGNLDLWVAHNMVGGQTSPLPDALLQGDGKGGFVDVSAKVGIQTVSWYTFGPLNAAKGHSWAWSTAACDLNNDGMPELLASSYGRRPNLLWRAAPKEGGGIQYVNESVASGYAYDHRFDWTDNLSAQCHCHDHPKDPECDKPPEPPPGICQSLKNSFGGKYRWNHSTDREAFNLGGNSGATVCADVDNDGMIDLMTHEIVHSDVGSSSDPSELLINQASAEVRFARPGGEVTGLVRDDIKYDWGGYDRGDMTGAIFDFDNDGWKDVYIGSSDYWGNHGLLFHQHSKQKFQRLDPADYFKHNRANGVAIADFDRDGDLDLFAGHSLMRCPEGSKYSSDCYPTQQIKLFRNLMGAGSNWLQVHLEGAEGSNRSAIGARVDIKTSEGPQTRVVDGGHGHFGTQRDATLHFGLGAACSAKVTVVWPDAKRTIQTFELSANQRYKLRQGVAEPVAAGM